ncbi:MAG: hypothetical protein ACRDJC_24105 [Thermomicrobiales bacterium]
MSDLPGMPPNPYVGPRAFTRKDTLFGRDVEKVNLLDLLISERIVLLYSPSGAGKTSLIQAGIVPALEEERFRPLPVIRVNRVSPHPNASRNPHPNPSPCAQGEGLVAAGASGSDRTASGTEAHSSERLRLDSWR